jgi:hypothetical protein
MTLATLDLMIFCPRPFVSPAVSGNKSDSQKETKAWDERRNDYQRTRCGHQSGRTRAARAARSGCLKALSVPNRTGAGAYPKPLSDKLVHRNCLWSSIAGYRPSDSY